MRGGGRGAEHGVPSSALGRDPGGARAGRVAFSGLDMFCVQMMQDTLLLPKDVPIDKQVTAK